MIKKDLGGFMIFESHAHYDDDKFNEDRHEVIESLKEHDVKYVMNIGSDMKSSRDSVELAKKYDFIFGSVGFHPYEIEKMRDEDLIELESLAKEKKIVAFGEIGLDYSYPNIDKELQIKRFSEQLKLAKKLDLPLVIHSRDATQKVYDMIKENGHYKGVIHCFAGSVEIAKLYVKLGFKIGIGGVVTFKNSNLPEVVKAIGIENIVVETDAPYLTPVPNRGKRNDSTQLKHICNKLAEILEIDVETVKEITFNNTVEAFKIRDFVDN